MAHQVSDEVYQEAFAAALSLKAELKERLLGKTSKGWKRGSDECPVGASRVVDVSFSPARDLIARACFWRCDLVDDHDQRWSIGINSYVSYAETFAMFRNRFKGIDVEVDHCQVALHEERALVHGHVEDRLGPGFKPSGRKVTVVDGEGVFLRPLENRELSPWFELELRLDGKVKRYKTKEPLLSINVDPFAFSSSPRFGRDAAWNRYEIKDSGTVYAQLFKRPDFIYLPIARLVESDVEKRFAIFELDKTVEAFNP